MMEWGWLEWMSTVGGAFGFLLLVRGALRNLGRIVAWCAVRYRWEPQYLKLRWRTEYAPQWRRPHLSMRKDDRWWTYQTVGRWSRFQKFGDPVSFLMTVRVLSAFHPLPTADGRVLVTMRPRWSLFSSWEVPIWEIAGTVVHVHGTVSPSDTQRKLAVALDVIRDEQEGWRHDPEGVAKRIQEIRPELEKMADEDD